MSGVPVWKLVSGLPSPEREAWRIMVLEADTQFFGDDSGSEPTSRYFVLAGFISTAGRWAAFSDAWKAELDGGPEIDPPLEYFKSTEAAGLRDQFSDRRGWTPEMRDRKMLAFAEIAREAAIARVACYLRNDLFERHIKSLPIPERRLASDNPYILLQYNLVIATAVRGPQCGIEPPCDFIFDRQLGFEDETLRHWAGVREAAKQNPRADLSPWVKQPPLFREDKDFLPLQAADLYAWHLRRTVRQNEVLWMPPAPALKRLEPLPEISRWMDEEELIRLRDYLIRMGRKVAQLNPDVPFVHASKGAPRRARNLGSR